MGAKVLHSTQVAMVERLVECKAKVKYIESMVGSTRSALIARSMYENLGERPPNGLSGAASSIRLRKPQLMSFTAMATRYTNARRFGVPAQEAALDVFAAGAGLFNSLHSGAINAWLGVARDMEVGNAGLFRCPCCKGHHLWQSGVPREYTSCIWCKEKIKMSPAAIKALYLCEGFAEFLHSKSQKPDMPVDSISPRRGHELAGLR